MTYPTPERRDAGAIIEESRAAISQFTQLLDELSETIDELEAETARQRCPEEKGRP